MLQFLADQIDQLDLAVDQLAVRDRNFDRFALMLVDNVVELTLHEHARAKDHENLMWGRYDKARHDPKVVAAALGPNFDAKLRLAKLTKLVSSESADSLLALHSLRNAVYHQGLRHEGILHAVAIFYFQLACEVLGAFEPPFWGSSSRDRISHRAVKYLGQVSIFKQREAFREACARLAEVAATFKQTLIVDLHADMESTIEETDGELDFLEKNSPTPMTRTEAVVDSQLWTFASTDEAQSWAIKNGWTGPFDGRYVNWLFAKYPWQYRVDPIPSWTNRLRSLKSETSQHAALKKYTDFMRQTQEVRSKIGELASHLDGYIQQQVDAARGK